ncbi:hypothetical protein [Reinekea blandensis]|uniref:Outer membrane protein beta-barrel domain-containing protein n=1 Tax=Reinekea blandensis MED297 TaxID=314283 RepID=A4BA09_9GAMM|nr:hypothetical protein [Reinekea blandensis]EAR11460.1 hypothetical protein MED297_21272 [Reinekea sp. MED297] [Reinekea blandensis MED297]
MKKFLFTFASLVVAHFFVLSALANASSAPERGFGIAANSAWNGQVLPIRTIITGFYHQGMNQIDLGLGFHPFIRQEQSIASADLNYKLFPNGRDNPLNLYLLANLSYIYTSRATFYPARYHYLFLLGGYGLELNGPAGTYLDTNVSFGGFTYKKDSENPASSYLDAEQFFKELGSTVSLQVGVGYRF